MAASVYEIITDRIISEMKKGIIPWHRPWFGVADGAFNRITKKPYSFLNQCLLGKAGEWASFKQWEKIGGKIKKGEKGSIVVFWKPQTIKEVKEDGTETVKSIPILRYYTVFHISQVEGVEPLAKSEMIVHEPIAEAETLKDAYAEREGIEITITESNRAYYSPALDEIVVPLKEQFENIEQFYATLFHEMTHSTGAKGRCDRFDENNKAKRFGDENYSKEELVAELGSASIINRLGIESEKSFKNSAAYIQSWLSALRNDKKFIVSACSKAQKAVEYIYGETETTSEE